MMSIYCSHRKIFQLTLIFLGFTSGGLFSCAYGAEFDPVTSETTEQQVGDYHEPLVQSSEQDPDLRDRGHAQLQVEAKSENLNEDALGILDAAIDQKPSGDSVQSICGDQFCDETEICSDEGCVPKPEKDVPDCPEIVSPNCQTSQKIVCETDDKGCDFCKCVKKTGDECPVPVPPICSEGQSVECEQNAEGCTFCHCVD